MICSPLNLFELTFNGQWSVFKIPQLFASLTAPIVAPAGFSENIIPFLLPSYVLSPGISPDIFPLMKYDGNGSCFVRRICQPVFFWLVVPVRQFGLKGAE